MSRYNRRYKKAFNPCINAEEVLEKLDIPTMESSLVDNDWDNLTHDEQYQINKDLGIEFQQVDRGIKQWL
jgi:hypothetical protein|tara:strand:- start:610 stop:819 length:210 start_codon:yes stop_codon:yes gene_type:complete